MAKAGAEAVAENGGVRLKIWDHGTDEFVILDAVAARRLLGQLLDVLLELAHRGRGKWER